MLFFLVLLGIERSEGGEGVQARTNPLQRAHVIVQKNIDADYLVQGRPFDVIYTAINIGQECVFTAPTVLSIP